MGQLAAADGHRLVPLRPGIGAGRSRSESFSDFLRHETVAELCAYYFCAIVTAKVNFDADSFSYSSFVPVSHSITLCSARPGPVQSSLNRSRQAQAHLLSGDGELHGVVRNESILKVG